MMRFFRRKPKPHPKVILHRPGATVYRDGRYIGVDARLSVRNARDRQIVQDVVDALLNQIIDGVALTYSPEPEPVPEPPLLGANGQQASS